MRPCAATQDSTSAWTEVDEVASVSVTVQCPPSREMVEMVRCVEASVRFPPKMVAPCRDRVIAHAAPMPHDSVSVSVSVPVFVCPSPITRAILPVRSCIVRLGLSMALFSGDVESRGRIACIYIRVCLLDLSLSCWKLEGEKGKEWGGGGGRVFEGSPRYLFA